MEANNIFETSTITRNITISLQLKSEQHLKVLWDALLPETKRPTTVRSKVTLKKERNTLIMEIFSADTSALRATLNSYLQWVIVVNDVLGLMTTSA
jgi:KEOPS complex subunit Pcc1